MADKCARTCATHLLRGSGSVASRSPFGAPPRHSPGRTHPPLAQLQFPRFLRPGSTGVTRCRLSRVYRAPRRPVVVPAERWPRAARERCARPRAGTALAPHLDRIRNAPFGERDSILGVVTKIETFVKRRVATSATSFRAPPNGSTRRSRPDDKLHVEPGICTSNGQNQCQGFSAPALAAVRQTPACCQALTAVSRARW
jgi:hypothetical protein